MADFDEILKVDPKLKDPKFEYRWVLDEKKNMIRRASDGYTKVLLADEPKFKEDPRANTVDGLVRVGDLILMKCPKAKVIERRQKRAEKADVGKAYEAIKEEFRQAAGMAGIPVIDDVK